MIVKKKKKLIEDESPNFKEKLFEKLEATETKIHCASKLKKVENYEINFEYRN